MAAPSGKRYGLILSSKKKPSGFSKPSVFGDDSSDEEDGKRQVNVSLRRENKKIADQTHDAVAKALEEDPSVFEYDTIYDEMSERKKAPLRAKKDVKPKYIHALKRTAERRKLEQEIVEERRVQKEIEAEAETFGDKEMFLTSAYRKKLEERKAMEEELRREQEREAQNDVRKQKDMGRFYHHLLRQKASGQEEVTKDDTQPPASSRQHHPTSRLDREDSREEMERREMRKEVGGKEMGRKEKDESRREQVEGAGKPNQQRPPSDIDGEAPPLPETESGGEAEEEEQEEGREKTPVEVREPTAAEKEERRRVASLKRTGEEGLLSAKERYLARKKARLTAPTS